METELTVDGTRYTYSHLKTGESLRLLNRLGKVVGPSIRSFFAEDGASFQSLGAAAVAELLANLDDATLDAVILTFGKQSSFTNDSGNFRLDRCWENHFMGKHMELFQWLAACLEAEYSSFFAGLAKLLGAPQAPKQ